MKEAGQRVGSARQCYYSRFEVRDGKLAEICDYMTMVQVFMVMMKDMINRVKQMSINNVNNNVHL